MRVSHRVRWISAIGLLGVVAMAPALCFGAAEEKEVVVSGARLLFGELPQPSALSLLSRDGVADFEVDGDDAALDRIDGRNHDLTGALTGSGDKAGVATDVNASQVETSDVTLAGSVPIEGNVSPFDVASYVNFLRARADLVLTENTTYTGGTIGSPSDYQVVVLENAKLFLKGGFTGYGVLVLYDTDPGNGQAELRMEDQATWSGVIVSYTGDTPGESDKIRMRFGDQAGGSGKGKGHGVAAGDGVQVLGLVIAAGREIEVKFPSGAVADLYYSSAAVANVDADLQTKPYDWERWREKE